MSDRRALQVVIAVFVLALLFSRLLAAAGEPQSAWLWGVQTCPAR